MGEAMFTGLADIARIRVSAAFTLYAASLSRWSKQEVFALHAFVNTQITRRDDHAGTKRFAARFLLGVVHRGLAALSPQPVSASTRGMQHFSRRIKTIY